MTARLYTTLASLLATSAVLAATSSCLMTTSSSLEAVSDSLPTATGKPAGKPRHKVTLGDRIRYMGMPFICFGSEIYDNPAMQRYHYNLSLNTLRVGMDYSKASQPMRLEQGTGHTLGLADIDAYLHRGKATLWGRAAYSNGSTRGIQYSETSDYELLYPYLMADTVGGSSRRERYHFMGGFSYPIGRWNIAAEGQYTALMEYRTRDPRPKNLTGDLRAKVGASYVMGADVIGAAITAGRYKQTNEVKLYNEVAVPTIYHLTGLGTDYYRFRGVNTSTYYKGYSLGGLLSYRHRHKSQYGPFAQAGYEFTEIDKIISSLNELPMATLRHHRQTAVAGWKFCLGSSPIGIKLTEQWQRRQGFEHIFGTAQDNIYPQIAIGEMYRLTTLHTGADVLWQHILRVNPIKSYITVQASTYYDTYHEQYAEPSREIQARSWTSGLTIASGAESRYWLNRISLTAYRTWHTTSSIDRVTGAMAAPTLHYYSTLAHGRWQAKASLESIYKVGTQWHPFVRIDWRYGHYAQSWHSQQVALSAGIYF